MNSVLFYIYVLLAITFIFSMWISIIRDLAQIRAAQKIEIEAIVNLSKILCEYEKGNK